MICLRTSVANPEFVERGAKRPEDWGVALRPLVGPRKNPAGSPASPL